MIRIGFLGFGQTGKEAVYPFLIAQDVSVHWVIKRNLMKDFKYASQYYDLNHEQGEFFRIHDVDQQFIEKYPVDVVIDFSNESNVNIYELFTKNGIKIISAISSLSEQKIEVLKRAAEHAAILWSPNITIGINLLIFAAEFIREITPDADIQIIESHFRYKRERSGTALRIAKMLDVDDSNIHSVRAGGILGTHEIIFGYPNQTIRLEHVTISRRAFGNGALLCARWIMHKHPRLYSMEEMLLEHSLSWYRKKIHHPD